MKKYYFKKNAAINGSDSPSQKNNIVRPKVVVAHPAQQHSYHLGRTNQEQISFCLHNDNLLSPKQNSLPYFESFAGKRNKQRMLNRRNSYIEPLTKQFDEINLAFLFWGESLEIKSFLDALGHGWVSALVLSCKICN